MDEEKFEVIIVGGGLAGLICAYRLANAGREVVLIERGSYCGSKNVTGGKLCTHSIRKIFPDFEESAPLERKIVRKKLSLWDGRGIKDIDFPDIAVTESEAWSVNRASLDSWLAELCEEAGVMLVTGIRVDDLMVRGGKVCGVIAGEDEMAADVVVLAEGINSLLGQKLGLVPELDPARTCVGTKEVIELGEDIINERFGLAQGEGIEWMFEGDRSLGKYADGFIYTNKSSVCIGTEFLLSDIDNTDSSVPAMLDEFKSTPCIASIIEGGRLVEYSAHLVPKGGAAALPRLYADGVLLIGDAARLVANFGFDVRGMDLAVESGSLAAEAIDRALEAGDCSADALSAYQASAADSFIASDMMECEKYFLSLNGE